LTSSSTEASFGQGFLSEEQCENNGPSSTLSSPAPADFCLFPLRKSAIKGWHFYDATDITKATKELKTFTKWFPGRFPTPLQLLAAVYTCNTGLFRRKGNLN
jgi:hypothetical protein